MAVQVQITRQQSETPAQWNRALQRALNESLDVLTEPTSGRMFVEAATNPGTIYEVTPDSCTCKAGARGVPCKHRACLLAQMGVLPLDEPVSAPLHPEPALVDCAACSGCGSVYSRSGGWKCDFCQGKGQVPTQPARIAALLSAIAETPAGGTPENFLPAPRTRPLSGT